MTIDNCSISTIPEFIYTSFKENVLTFSLKPDQKLILKITLRREEDKLVRLKEELHDRLKSMILNFQIPSNFKSSIYEEITFSLDHPSQIFDRVFVNFTMAKALIEVFADCGFEYFTNYGGYDDMIILWNNYGSDEFQYLKNEEPMTVVPNSKIFLLSATQKQKSYVEFKIFYGTKNKDTICNFNIGKKPITSLPQVSTPRFLSKVLSLGKVFDFSGKS